MIIDCKRNVWRSDILMLFAFWTCVPLLVIGLFLGCRYSFSGQDFDKTVEYMKKTAAEA